MSIIGNLFFLVRRRVGGSESRLEDLIDDILPIRGV